MCQEKKYLPVPPEGWAVKVMLQGKGLQVVPGETVKLTARGLELPPPPPPVPPPPEEDVAVGEGRGACATGAAVGAREAFGLGTADGEGRSETLGLAAGLGEFKARTAVA